MPRSAECPNCGATIQFLWSGAVQTTCEFCRSILVRHDLDLEKVGTVADVPPSTSRIQIGTEGRYRGTPFVVVGRIIYEYERGHWSEWHCRASDDTSLWLSDAQGEYAVTWAAAPGTPLPASDALRRDQDVMIDGTPFRVSVLTRARYRGVEGELPFEYWDKSEVLFADLKSGADRFATIDYSEEPPLLYVGEFEEFDELHLGGLREEDDAAGVGGAPRARAKGLNCPSCGSAIELVTGALAQTVACPSCAAILDAKDPNLRILQRFSQQAERWPPAIPLGTEGTLKGERWRVVGFQVREISVEGEKYRWREYLLWNADRGFRYLSEYDGHWNDISVVKGTPKIVSAGTQPVVEYLGQHYKHFQTAVASTLFVLGEFPWQVRVGDTVKTDDYVSPPLMLSREITDDETSWSIGTYTPPERIREAFGLKKSLPSPKGIFANQPNPRRGIAGSMIATYLVLAAVTVGIFVARFATARDERVFAQRYVYDQGRGDTLAFVTAPFELKGHTSAVRLTIDTNLDNNWAYFNVALIPENGGDAFELGREVSRYRGVDQGESWSEGSARDRAVFPQVPPGRYFLRVEPERDAGGPPFDYTLAVERDVPRAGFYFIPLLLLLLPVIGAVIMEHSFEQQRWQESDHAPVATSDDDDE